MTRCNEIMTKTLIAGTTATTLVGAASLMQNHDFGALPILDSDNKLIGLITDRDIVVHAIASNLDPAETPVDEIMSEDLITCRQSDEIEVALQRMREAQIRRIPVVDEHNHMVGIISQADIALHTEDSGRVGNVVEAISRPE